MYIINQVLPEDKRLNCSQYGRYKGKLIFPKDRIYSTYKYIAKIFFKILILFFKFLLLIITSIFALGSTESLPKFTLTKDRLVGEVPSVKIEFPDGTTDTLKLKRYYSSKEISEELASNRCNFIGHLAKEPGACVGFTGCPELEDVELTIMSSRIFGSPLFKWKRNGNVERIIHPYMVEH